MNIKFSGMILAAGYGKRLMPLTKDIPKPLISINGITLLDNSINFLKNLGCNQIIINTHYMNIKIENFVNKRRDKNIITLIHEEEILDTAGAVKNAINFFENENIIVINSDIFWQNKNIQDAKKLILKYKNHQIPHLLLVKKINAFGLDNFIGDFILEGDKIKRFKKGNKIIYYSGFQILNLAIFKNILSKIISFNSIWDNLIDKDKLSGSIMSSNWYHVGDMKGLEIAKKIDS